jgi:hypothetical protein
LLCGEALAWDLLMDFDIGKRAKGTNPITIKEQSHAKEI